jgi:hypothetical protein
MQLLLVARKGRARDRFLEELARLAADCHVTSTPEELSAATRHTRYSGVLFDVPTILREKSFDPKLLRSLTEVYPSARLRYDAAADAVYALGAGTDTQFRGGLSVFVAACRDFLPRGLRRGERIDANLPVVLWRARPDGSGAGERTCTLNVSYLGCFVVTTASWDVAETAWLEFPDVTPGPLRARVAWHEPWGRRRAVPGIGLAFLERPETLFEELRLLGCEPDDLEVASP